MGKLHIFPDLTLLFRNQLALLVTCIAALGTVGCSPDSGLVPIEGHVLLDGEPVSNAAVMFMPSQGLPAQGVTDDNGRFKLTTAEAGDGAAIGNYKVTVTCREVTGRLVDDEPQSPFHGYVRGTMKVKWIVPERYSLPTTSPLAIEVSKDTDVVQLDLSSKQT